MSLAIVFRVFVAVLLCFTWPVVDGSDAEMPKIVWVGNVSSSKTRHRQEDWLRTKNKKKITKAVNGFEFNSFCSMVG